MSLEFINLRHFRRTGGRSPAPFTYTWRIFPCHPRNVGLDLRFRALSGRLKFTVRRHTFNEDDLSFGAPCRTGGRRTRAVPLRGAAGHWQDAPGLPPTRWTTNVSGPHILGGMSPSLREGVSIVRPALLWDIERSIDLFNGSLCFSTLPTGTKVESGTSQSKSGTSVNLIKSGLLQGGCGRG